VSCKNEDMSSSRASRDGKAIVLAFSLVQDIPYGSEGEIRKVGIRRFSVNQNDRSLKALPPNPKGRKPFHEFRRNNTGRFLHCSTSNIDFHIVVLHRQSLGIF
jgi:hypothetical protein